MHFLLDFSSVLYSVNYKITDHFDCVLRGYPLRYCHPYIRLRVPLQDKIFLFCTHEHLPGFLEVFVQGFSNLPRTWQILNTLKIVFDLCYYINAITMLQKIQNKINNEKNNKIKRGKCFSTLILPYRHCLYAYHFLRSSLQILLAIVFIYRTFSDI